jgi:hypothetical protein
MWEEAQRHSVCGLSFAYSATTGLSAVSGFSPDVKFDHHPSKSSDV